MILSQNRPQINEEAGVSTDPPQLKPPLHQKYVSMLPTKDFSRPAVSVSAPVIAGVGAPSDYFGVPIYDALNMKADIMAIDREGVKSQAVGVLTSSTNPVIAMADTYEELRKKYPTQESMKDKRIALIGKMPLVKTTNSSHIVIPPDVAGDISGQAGKIMFPVRHDMTIPLLMPPPRDSERLNLDQGNENSGLIAMVTIIFLILAVIAMYNRI